MKNNITFGSWEAVCLLITMISTKAILTFPRYMAESAGSAAWLLVIYLSAIALIGFYIISKLFSGFEGKDLLDIGELAGGKPVKIVTGAVLLAYLIQLASLNLRSFGEQMKTMGLINSPISFLIMFFLIGAVIGVYYGIEAIIRFQSVLVPVSVIAFSLYIIALIPSVEISGLLPILGSGAYDVFVKSIPRVSSFSELLFLFLLGPFIKSGKIFNKAGYVSIGISAAVMLSITTTFTGVYPYPTCLEGFLPAYQLGRMINFGRFFQRAESVMVVTWATIGFMYLSTCFYFIMHVFRKTFDLPYQNPLILPLSIIIFNISLLPPSLISNTEILTKAFSYWSFLIAFVFVIVLLLSAKIIIRRKKADKKA